MQQQQATNTTIGVKATFVPTDEHRFLALPSPPSFAVLIGKLATLFAIDSASDLRVHYIDDESDRVAMSSSDELTCALSLVPAGRQLRLFVTSEAALAVPSPMRLQQQEKQVKDEPSKALECALPTAIVSSIVEASPNSAVERAVSASEASSQEVATSAIDVLKGQLQAAGIEIGPDGFDEHRCQRARFEGNVAKAAKAVECMHARKLLRQQQQQVNGSDVGKADARQAQREARKSERLAARLARQEERNQKQRNKQLGTDDDANDNDNVSQSRKKIKPVDAAAVDTLMAFIAGQKHEGTPIAPIGRGKCTAALRKSDGDVEAAKAFLLAWSAKRRQRQNKQHQGKKGADLDMAKLLEQLEGLGFGAPAVIAAGPDDNDNNVCKANMASERIQRRNERLIKRFGGELSHVVEFLEARQAKVDARKTAVRKARGAQDKPRCARRHLIQEHQNEQVATAL
jgi:hypothetical protein